MVKKKADQQATSHTHGSPTSTPLPETPPADGATGRVRDPIEVFTQMIGMMQMQRQEDKEEERRRFDALLARLTPQQVPAAQITGSDPSTSLAPQVMSKPLLPKATPPPALSQDVTLLQFKEWQQQWEDYAVMVDLDSLSQPKQLVQLRASLSAEMRRVLEVTLGVPASSTLTVSEVISRLRDFVRGQRNEAL